KPGPTGPRSCRLRRRLPGVVPGAQRLEIFQRVVVPCADVVYLRGLLCTALTRVRPDVAALVPVTRQHRGTPTPPVPRQTIAPVRTGPAHGPSPFFPSPTHRVARTTQKPPATGARGSPHHPGRYAC